jgi:hypothetical protein
MTDKQQDWETPPKTDRLSVREARKTRAVWEDDKMREMINIGMDPLGRADMIQGSWSMIALLKTPRGIASSLEVANALDPNAEQKNYQVSGKLAAKFAYMGCGYTMKLSTPGHGGGQTRYFSKQAVVMIGMHGYGPVVGSFRAWVAEVVARASTHHDFADLMDWKHPDRINQR